MLEVGGHGLLFDVFAISVAIRRGPAVTTGVAATWQKHEESTFDEQGLTTAVIDRTWTIHVTDYALSGTAVDPRAGDRIQSPDGKTWECLRLEGRPAAELDSSGLHWEIHTKRVA